MGQNEQTENSLPINLNNKVINNGIDNTASFLKTTQEKTKTAKNALSTPSTNQTPPKTLVIGDSILKGINKRGLSENTDVRTLRGAKVKDISFSISKWNHHSYAKYVIYVGGNDVGSADIKTIYSELKETVAFLKQKNNDIYLCTVCPRSDCDVVPLNNSLKELSQELHVNIIDTYSSFVYGDGNTARNYYMRDGIHLNNHGTRNLVSSINRVIPVIKLKATTTPGTTRNDTSASDRIHHSLNNQRDLYCNYCMVRNHNTRDCRRVYRSTENERRMYASRDTWSTSSRFTGSEYPYDKRLDNRGGYGRRESMR